MYKRQELNRTAVTVGEIQAVEPSAGDFGILNGLELEILHFVAIISEILYLLKIRLLPVVQQEVTHLEEIIRSLVAVLRGANLEIAIGIKKGFFYFIGKNTAFSIGRIAEEVCACLLYTSGDALVGAEKAQFHTAPPCIFIMMVIQPPAGTGRPS